MTGCGILTMVDCLGTCVAALDFKKSSSISGMLTNTFPQIQMQIQMSSIPNATNTYIAIHMQIHIHFLKSQIQIQIQVH